MNDNTLKEYLKKVKNQEKWIEKMNLDLHAGHVRALDLCSNCFKYLGREGIQDNLLWTFENRLEMVEGMIKKKVVREVSE